LGRSGGDTEKRAVVVQGFEKKSGLGKRVAEELERGVLRVACPNGEQLTEGGENYKVYKNQYKRICTHLRRNGSLAQRLSSGELAAEDVATMDDDALMAESQRSERELFKKEGLHEALGITAEDSAHWTPSDSFTCPACESIQCMYIQWFKGFHGYDDNNQEPVITIRCTVCKHLWKEDEVEGGRMAAGTFVFESPGSSVQASNVPDKPLVQSEKAKGSEPPAIWGETRGRRAPTWLLPASS